MKKHRDQVKIPAYEIRVSKTFILVAQMDAFVVIPNFWARIRKDVKKFGEGWGRVSNWTPALIRSASQCVGVPSPLHVLDHGFL